MKRAASDPRLLITSYTPVGGVQGEGTLQQIKRQIFGLYIFRQLNPHPYTHHRTVHVCVCVCMCVCVVCVWYVCAVCVYVDVSIGQFQEGCTNLSCCDKLSSDLDITVYKHDRAR